MMIKHALLAASFGLMSAGDALAFNPIWGASFGDARTFQAGAYLTTASRAFEDDFPQPAGAFNVSGVPALEAGIANGLELAAGLTIGSLDLNGSFATEGSVVGFGGTFSAGDRLSFDWRFFTNESGANAQPDYAFMLIDNTLTVLADAADATLTSSPYALTTGPQPFTYTFTSSGLQRIAFGVVDVNDFNATSALQLENFVLAPIPEADTYVMMAIGLGLMGWWARRRA